MSKNKEEKPVRAETSELIKKFEFMQEEYKRMRSLIEDGDFFSMIFKNLSSSDVSKAKADWAHLWEEMRTMTESLNALRHEVATSLRREVSDAVPQDGRGEGGSVDSRSVGPFTVTSTTSRSINAEKLVEIITESGDTVLKSIMMMTRIDKNGQSVPIIRKKWEADYSSVMSALRSAEREDVIELVYVENEMTPRVSGPKEKTFFAEDKSGSKEEK